MSQSQAMEIWVPDQHDEEYKVITGELQEVPQHLVYSTTVTDINGCQIIMTVERYARDYPVLLIETKCQGHNKIIMLDPSGDGPIAKRLRPLLYTLGRSLLPKLVYEKILPCYFMLDKPQLASTVKVTPSLQIKSTPLIKKQITSLQSKEEKPSLKRKRTPQLGTREDPIII